MSFEDSCSQDSSIPSRNQENQSKNPASLINTAFISLAESAQAPSYQQGFPTRTTSWTFDVPALENYTESTHNFSTSLQSPHNSTASLDSSTNIPSSIQHSNTPLSGQSDQSSFNVASGEEQLTDDQGSGLGISSYPMSVASGTYFAGPMQPHSQHYSWANRPFQPLQSPPGNMNQQFPSPQSYPPAGYPVGHSGHAGVPLSNYHQELPVPSSYLSTTPGSVQRQPQSRSPSVPRPFPPHSAAGNMPLPDQPLMTSSPPYNMIGHSPYYHLPEAPPVPSSHPSSISSHTSPMMHDPIFSHDSTNATSTKEQQLHVMSSRPRPQCWDHGCNGREFSTFSNLLRHQREKSGVVAKAECPVCGAVFTRTTARNIHVAQGKCRGAGRESPTE